MDAFKHEVEGGAIILRSAERVAAFAPETKVVFSYRLNATRGHCVCVPLQYVFGFKKEIAMAVTRIEDGLYGTNE